MAKSKLIYGLQSVIAALKHQPENVLSLFYAGKSKEVLDLAKAHDIVVQPISKDKYPQGIAAMVRVTSPTSEQSLYDWLSSIEKKPIILVLEGIQDPHNLGACLRSAEAFGVDKVIVSRHDSAPLNATVSKVACGADQRLSIITVSSIQRVLNEIKKYNVWVVGTALSDEAKPLMTLDFTKSIALVMGAEGKGLKPSTLSTCDEIGLIPMKGKVESLNVSVATGICLYECVRQRRG